MKQMDLTDIHRTVNPKTKEYAFFSEPHDISKIEHIIKNKSHSKVWIHQSFLDWGTK